MNKILILIAITIGLVSCSSKSAFKFSETIVAKEKSLEPELVKTENEVTKFSTAGQFDSMAAVSEKMERLVDDKLNEIKDLKAPNVKYSEEFKKDAIDYFSYMKSVYTSYAKYAKAESDDTREQEMKHLQDIVSKKNDVIKKMRDSQKKFADANNFKIKD